tara:strand:- start:3978 stop:4403 length:426 start_codon:yes stop_codon:yes gene_type:complete
MLTAFSAFFSVNKLYFYIAGAVALAGIVGGAYWTYTSVVSERDELEIRVGTLNLQLEFSVTLANKNAAALIDYKRIAQANLDAVVAEHEAQEVIEERVRVIYKTIENVSAADDGPVANVLIDTAALIDGLRPATTEDAPSN